jgi:CRISPR-associated protein Csb2
MVSAWGNVGGEDSLRGPLEWLESQEPPVIHAGNCSQRTTVRAYVPVNDRLEKPKEKKFQLPEDRVRKVRSFPSATLSHPEVYFEWAQSPKPKLIPAFERILDATTSLGHPASLVEAAIVESVPQSGHRVWHPNSGTGIRIRISHKNRLDELIESYKLFKSTGNKVFRPSNGTSVLYSETRERSESATPSLFGPMIVLRRDHGPKASLQSALSITSALRSAVMAYAPQPCPEFLSGHSIHSTEENPIRSENQHLAFVPLANVSAPYAKGEILGVAAVMPRSLTTDERAICWDTVEQIKELRMPWGNWLVSITDAEEPTKGLRQEKWAARGKIWSTVTPFVFDKYPKDPYGAEAEETARTALKRVGLPEPVEIDLHYNPWHTGALKASAYPPAPARQGKSRRYHCHVWVRFENVLQGPVIAGAGRFYGYGLFLPLHHSGAGR